MEYFNIFKIKEILQRKKEKKLERIAILAVKREQEIKEFQNSMDTIKKNIEIFNMAHDDIKDLTDVLFNFFWALEYIDNMYDVKFDPFDIKEECKTLEEKKRKTIEFATDNYLLRDSKFVLNGIKISVLKKIVKSDILNDYHIRLDNKDDEIYEKFDMIDRLECYLIKYYGIIKD